MADNWTLTIDTGGGQVSTDYSTWASMIAAIAASKASLVYCKIKQNGSPTLPTTFYNLFSGFSKLTTLIFDGFVYQPTTAQIKATILANILPIMYVDFDDTTSLIEMHWVLGIGVVGDDVIIADPWTGGIGKLSEHYPKAVIRYGSYRRQA